MIENTENAKDDFGIVKSKIRPTRELLLVPHRDAKLTISYPPFGSATFVANLKELGKNYSHPQTLEQISFREPTTSESISAIAYKFEELAKPIFFKNDFNHDILQIGRVVNTAIGIFVNVPKDKDCKPITDESKLATMLNGLKPKKIRNGKIYLGKNDFGFAEYTSFVQGIMSPYDFAEGGLARIIEHTEESALSLRTITSQNDFDSEIQVSGFKYQEDKRYSGGIITLGIGTDLSWDAMKHGRTYIHRLMIKGRFRGVDDWSGSEYDGFLFGVLK